jgi:putative tricarboxylic transport membrane protein
MWIAVGVFVGIVFGAIPGLTATTAIALFTPITFGLGFNESFGFLLGIYCGGYWAGAIPSILIRTPGAPGNAATALDGYPMAMSGRPAEALTISLVASWIGGVFSAITLFFFSPLISSLALDFGPQEYFSVAILGFTAVASISGKSLYKGLAAGMIGLVLSFVGLDPIDGVPRFTFGSINLLSGIETTPALIGLFAVSEALASAEKLGVKAKEIVLNMEGKMRIRWKTYWENRGTVLKSAVIGTIIGAIPGTGSVIASWLSYNEAKLSSKNPEEFGKGAVAGIIAPEVANNAVTGGACIPLLTLGIPGDPTTAVLLYALIIQGLTPGPLMIRDKFDMFAVILFILLIANFMMLGMGMVLTKQFAKVLRTPKHIMVPVILVLCVAGAYGAGNSMFEVRLALTLGVFAFFAVKLGFPVAPMVLGLVLGPVIEPNFRRALIGSQMNPAIFITSPISAVFLALTVLIVVVLYRRNKKIDKSLNQGG